MPTPPEPAGERYRFEALVPDAGLGEVWAAFERARGDAPVFVKLLGAGPAGDEADPRSLPGIVDRLRRTTHPDVLPALGWGEHQGRLYLAHERFEGRSLASWLAGHRKARTRPGLATAQRLFHRVVGALEAVRGGGDAAHGALSPRSVLVRREAPGQYEVRVVDFGAAHLLVLPAGVAPAHEAYRAPELLDDPSRDSPRSDVFALAALLAELTSPALAPAADGPAAWAALAREGAPKLRAKLSALRSDLPAALWDVVALGLHADAAQRPEHPGAFAALLEQQWKRAGLWDKAPLTPEPDPPEAPPPPSPSWDRATTRFQGASSTPSVAVPSAPPPSVPPSFEPLSLPVSGPLPGLTPGPQWTPALHALPVASPLPALAPPVAPSPAAWRAPPPQARVTAWDHVDEGAHAPPVPLRAPAALPGVVEEATRRAPTLAAPRVVAPTKGPMVAPVADLLSNDHTALDVVAPPPDPDDASADEAPFEDPSPTPPDGVQSFAVDEEAVTEWRGNVASSPSSSPPSAAAPRGRLRARTLAADEGERLASLRGGPDAAAMRASPAPEPEGTRMIQLGWEQAPTPTLPSSPAPTPLPSPPVAPVAPVVERTVAIDLAASGVSAPSPSPSPPWSSPGVTPHAWTPPPTPPAAPPGASASSPVGWIVAGVAGTVALVVAVWLLARAF